MRTAGFVLVGGGSTRMGRDKARLPVASRLLVQEVAKTVRQAAGNVCLIGPVARYADLGLECMEDMRPSLGPLAGIETALASGRAEFNLIVACDMPDLEPEWLGRLIAQAQESHACCLVAQDAAGVVHPLCGVWTPECLPYTQRALDENRLRVLDLIDQLKASVLTAPGRLLNINTPEEWAIWQLTR